MRQSVAIAAVAAGGALGSVLRYLVSTWFVARGATAFPWGTFFINVTGSFVIGIVLQLALSKTGLNPYLRLFFATGILGGYTTWHLGRKGGQNALRRWVSPRILNRIVVWVERHHMLAIFLPAILPPPIPLSPFVLASGALGVPFKRFLAAYGAARTLRYSLVAWLAVLYGRHVVRLWSKELDKWSTPLLYVFLAVSVAGIAVGVWQFRSQRNSPSSADPSLEPETARVD